MTMSDKERILLVLVQCVARRCACKYKQEDIFIDSDFEDLNIGDLVVASTTLVPNEFVVGFVKEVHKEDECLVIREIGSDRVVNYSNERFIKIDKKILGYEILEGVENQTYQKVRKAFSQYSLYKFKDVKFNSNVCIVKARKYFSNDVLYEISFEFSEDTTFEYIGELLKQKEKDS